jgi:hypothetical protein
LVALSLGYFFLNNRSDLKKLFGMAVEFVPVIPMVGKLW